MSGKTGRSRLTAGDTKAPSLEVCGHGFNVRYTRARVCVCVCVRVCGHREYLSLITYSYTIVGRKQATEWVDR